MSEQNDMPEYLYMKTLEIVNGWGKLHYDQLNYSVNMMLACWIATCIFCTVMFGVTALAVCNLGTKISALEKGSK